MLPEILLAAKSSTCSWKPWAPSQRPTSAHDQDLQAAVAGAASMFEVKWSRVVTRP